MITAGIDSGSATTKAVLVTGEGIAGARVSDTGFDFLTVAGTVLSDLLAETGTGRDEVERIYATGYGRNSITFADKAISEITAQARGVRFLYPDVQGIIDIGGQDSKIIVVEDGNVTDFLMNDKCAAGTGKFLEYTANALEVPVSSIGELALASRTPAVVSSMCTVFAGTEVISLRAAGVSKEDIAAGLIAGIARRVAGMARQAGLKDQIAFVGGVAKNSGMRVALERELGVPLFVPPDPQVTAALGAAIAARG